MITLFVQGGFGAGGAEKVVSMIAAHRAAKGDDVHVVGMSMPNEGSYFRYPDAVTLHAVDRTNPATRLLAIRSLIRRLRPDIVLSFLTKINVLTLAAARGLGVPVVISERNNPHAQAAHPFWLRGQNALGRRASAIIMQTDRARGDLPEALERRAVVIPNPCGVADLPPISESPGQGGDRLLRLVAAGRLDRQKGFDVLLRAMPKIRAGVPNCRLTIHGEGADRAILERLRRELGLEDVVFLPGASKQPEAWLRDADILVCPSRYEGFPNVLAEATVSGLPVVATDCAYGPRELIRPGENGLLVPSEDVSALSEAVLNLALNPDLRRAMAGAAQRNREWLAPDRILRLWDGVIDAGRPA